MRRGVGTALRIKPILEDLAQNYKVHKVNIDEQENLANAFEISRIPTLIFFKDGQEVGNRLTSQNQRLRL